jgi:hypothetical protein
MATISDFLLNSTAANVGTWVRLVNNVTGLVYISTAATTASGLFTISNIPSGNYTLQTGVTNTGPWVPTTDVNYTVPVSTLTFTNLTDATNVFTDCSTGDYFKLTATLASRTIAIPANPVTGQTIHYDIFNNTGGVTSTFWSAVFKLASGFWVDPNTGKRRIVEFVYDGTNWIEQNRTSGDV